MRRYVSEIRFLLSWFICGFVVTLGYNACMRVMAANELLEGVEAGLEAVLCPEGYSCEFNETPLADCTNLYSRYDANWWSLRDHQLFVSLPLPSEVKLWCESIKD